MDYVEKVYEMTWNMGCISHTICHTSDKIEGSKIVLLFSNLNL